jgi:outer membrane protein OmpA-like peptidoglycan-associated protein/outer membrane protein W
MNISKLLLSVVALVMLFFATVQHADAQSDRKYFYFLISGGVVSYHGDLTDVNTDESMFSYGFSGGLGYAFTPVFSIASEYRVGDYPRTIRPNAALYTKRHNANLYMRFNLLPSKSVSPYITAGAGMTFFGTYDKRVQEADGSTYFGEVFGPMLGIGLDFKLSDRVSLFIDNKWDFITDDLAMDEIEGDTGFDVLNYIGAGLRLSMRSTFRPVSTFSLSGPQQLLAGEDGNFGISLVDDPTPPIEYEWDFGDGTTKFGQNVAHSYAQPGNYTVTATVSNARSSQERQMLVRVRARPEPARIAALRADNTQPDVGQPVRFIADITGTEPVSVSWNFGDGTTSQQKLAQHSYSEPGEYTVTLTVDNTAVAGEGARGTRTLRIRVQEPDVEIPAMRTVHFALNSSYFDDETRQILRENIRIMQENPGLCVVVKGYTDGTGADRYNQWLSERRAERVKDFYVENGIMTERIHFTGEGLAPEPCPAGATGCRENRRVETELVECE